MWLQGLAIRGGPFRGSDVDIRRRSRVLTAAHRPREAVVECRGERCGRVFGNSIAAQQDSPSFWIEPDLVSGNISFMSPGDDRAAAVDDIAEVRDSNHALGIWIVRRRRSCEP